VQKDNGVCARNPNSSFPRKLNRGTKKEERAFCKKKRRRPKEEKNKGGTKNKEKMGKKGNNGTILAGNDRRTLFVGKKLRATYRKDQTKNEGREIGGGKGG